MVPETCAFIFARGGSKGVSRKNLRIVAGQTLLERSIRIAREIDGIREVFVSTDDDEIASEAVRHGAQVIRRGEDLSGDHSPEWLAWQHAITTVRGQGFRCDRFLSVPTTSPLRTPNDVAKCLEALDDKVDCVVTMTPSSHHPSFNMVVPNRNHLLTLAAENKKPMVRRQDSAPLFSLTTVAYSAHADFVLAHESLWEGRIRGVEIPQERALDIDTEWDLHLADLVLSGRLNNV